ncbi:MAG TPA: TIGR02147 family protein [Chitinispirillaceae bacterium]|nr:TIGR02147 family protein [Chitinispirillaceae bacterium]
MNRIEHYDNYRDFLSDWFEDRKARFQFFSNRYFCQKAGIKSPSLFSEVVKGSRNLTDKTIPLFIKGLGLTDSDAAFFTVLVHLNQAQDPKERDVYTTELKKFRDKVHKEVIPAEHYEYYSRWYNPVLRELACLIKWNEDYRFLASCVNPTLKESQARESVMMLLRLGFIEKDGQGNYRQSTPVITSGNHVHASGVRSLNKAFAEMASEAVEKHSPDKRYISSMTIGISQNAYKQIEQEFEEFKDRIRRIVNDDKDSDRVYNVNLHLFPLSDNPGEKNT